MAQREETVAEIVVAGDWNERVTLTRRIPQRHGTDEHSAIYAAVARACYVPNLAPDFAYVHWRPDYELATFSANYEVAARATSDFRDVSLERLSGVLEEHPQAVQTFRTILGFTTQEFAQAVALVTSDNDWRTFTTARLKSVEAGTSRLSNDHARACAIVVHALMTGGLFADPPGDLRRKLEKPDTEDGWASVQRFATEGVPFATYLHQRHYGGAFRQLLDATSTRRGDLIEDAVEAVFRANRVSYVRTGAHNQTEIERRFGVIVQPAPDFVVFDPKSDELRAMLECKGANDGGTARDKALRFVRLREESIRLNGTPLFAVLAGLGWTRVNDTLGPVVRDCDGRVFTLANLDEMLTVHPFPALRNAQKD